MIFHLPFLFFTDESKYKLQTVDRQFGASVTAVTGCRPLSLGIERAKSLYKMNEWPTTEITQRQREMHTEKYDFYSRYIFR